MCGPASLSGPGALVAARISLPPPSPSCPLPPPRSLQHVDSASSSPLLDCPTDPTGCAGALRACVRNRLQMDFEVNALSALRDACSHPFVTLNVTSIRGRSACENAPAKRRTTTNMSWSFIRCPAPPLGRPGARTRPGAADNEPKELHDARLTPGSSADCPFQL